MQRLVMLLFIVALGWFGYGKYQQHMTARQFIESSDAEPVSVAPLLKDEAVASSSFRCDGRTHCSQMTSCTEATYFLKNCPGVKMDGNNDGVPCEQQWCN